MEEQCTELLSEGLEGESYTMARDMTIEDNAGVSEIQQQQLALHVKQLMAEKLSLEDKNTENQFSLTQKLLVNELERLQNGCRPFTGGTNKLGHEERRFADIIKDKPIKVTIRVLVPAKEHPKFNFVGKLLGPKGNSLKRLQEDTMTKMAILGRGSMRDKHKEEELRLSNDPKFSHLNDDLHVEVTAFAPPAEAHARIAYALAEVRRFLVPDYNDDIRQGQMREMQLLNTSPMTMTAACEVADPPAQAQVSPAASPAPSVASSATGHVASGKLNGRPLNYAANPQAGGGGGGAQGGRNCFLYNQQQQLLIHPAFRGLAPRGHDLQMPAATVFRNTGSILNRLRPPHHLSVAANNNRVSPTAIKQRANILNHHGNSILSILAGGPRSLFADQLIGESAMANENMLLCASDSGMPGTGSDDDVVSSAGLFGGYENYVAAAAAAAAAANGNGYAMLDGYANGNGLMTPEHLEELSLGQDAINSGLTMDLSGSRVEGAGSVKIDRSRYRHDPYGRFTGVKLPL